MSKSLKYSKVPADRSDDVAALLLNNFFRDEPIGAAVGLPQSQVSRWLPLYVAEAVGQNASFMAVESDTGKIIGVTVNLINKKDGQNLSMGSYFDPVTEPTMCLIGRFLGQLNSGIVRPNDPDRILTCVFLNVEPSYGGKGIARELTVMAEKYAISLGIDSFQVDTTSEFSYKMYKAVGYETLKEERFADFLDGGVKVLHKMDSGVHKIARILYKVVRQ